jgi:hypothetical protein
MNQFLSKDREIAPELQDFSSLMFNFFSSSEYMT